MKRLLWKELREKRVWLALLAVSVVGVTAFRRPYTFLGWANLADFLWLPSALIALLYGLTAYSSEIGWGTPDFLFSRPISWKKVLGVKLIVAFGTMLAAALVGAAIVRLWAPETHIAIIARYRLVGIGIALLVMGAPYLAGLVSSLVFPGFLGSVIVLIAVLGTVAVEALVLRHSLQGPPWILGMFLGCLSASVIVAAIVTSRFGLTLTVRRRAVRYAEVVSVGALAAAALVCWLPHKSWIQGTRSYYWISPDGSYVLTARDTYSCAGLDEHVSKQECRLTRLSDGLARKLPWKGYVYWPQWTPDGTVYAVDDSRSEEPPVQILTARIDPSGKLIGSRSTPWRVRYYHFRSSTNGNYAAMYRRVELDDGSHDSIYRFFDIPNHRVVNGAVRGVSVPWWQDDKTFGWRDKQGKRHFLKLRD